MFLFELWDLVVIAVVVELKGFLSFYKSIFKVEGKDGIKMFLASIDQEIEVIID